MSGEAARIILDVAEEIGEADALSREGGERLAAATARVGPGALTLDFSAITAINSAFMAGFLFALIPSTTLDDLRARMSFKGLSPSGAEVVRNSIRRVREQLAE